MGLDPATERFAQAVAKLQDSPHRQKAYNAFAQKGTPHRRVEGWRWSDLRAALKGIQDAPKAESAPTDPFNGLSEDVFCFSDNGYTPPKTPPAGLTYVGDDNTPPFTAAQDLPMAALAAALANNPSVVLIDITASPENPIRLVFEGDADRSHHVVIRLQEGVEATVLESVVSSGGFSNVVIDYQLAPKARLDRYIIQDSADHAVQLHTTKVNLMDEAVFNQTAFANGARLFRLDTRLTHEREGAHATLNGAYLVDDGAHCDMTSLIIHSAPGCKTEQLIKGAARKGGKGAFQGKFHVECLAQKTDADMQHKALLLEDGAEINAKPELEIYADDVACAHGNTCGALDEDQLFYMRQRGIPEAQARALLTESFVADAFDDVGSDEVRQRFLSAAREWLEGAKHEF